MSSESNALCTDCPDHEACMTGYNCDHVKEMDRKNLGPYNVQVGDWATHISDRLDPRLVVATTGERFGASFMMIQIGCLTIEVPKQNYTFRRGDRP